MKNSIKKITKKQIASTLRRGKSTEIFALAAKMGIDVSNKGNVFHFIQDNAPSQKVYSAAFWLSYGAADFKNFRCYRGCCENPPIRMPIHDAMKFARMQKKDNWMSTNYGKILIVGNRHIYWAHPGYGHSDYNKSVAFANTENNRRAALLVNKYLGY